MADFEQELKKPVLQRAKLKLQQWCMKVRFKNFLSGKAKITRLKRLYSMSVDKGNKKLNLMLGSIPQALGAIPWSLGAIPWTLRAILRC